MGVISAVDLVVGGESRIEAFKIFYKGQGNNAYSASGLSGGTGRTRYIKNWWGWYSGVGYHPVAFPGGSVSLLASLDGSHGFTGTAKIGTLEIRGSVEEGGPIRYLVQFGSDSALTLGSAVAPEAGDATHSDGIDLLLEYSIDDGSNWSAEREIREASLRFHRPFLEYSSSGLPGVVRRNCGPLDAQIRWKMYEDTPSAIHGINTNLRMRMRVAPAVTGPPSVDAKYWTLANVMAAGLDDFGGQKMGRENIGGEMLAELDVTRAGTTLGFIESPSAVNVWPT